MKTSNGEIDVADGSGFLARWHRFWLAPIAPTGLHWIRFLTGLLLLAWLLPLSGQRDAFFGLGGWFDRAAISEANRLPGGAPVAPGAWSLVYLCGSDPTMLAILWWGSIGVLCLFTLGIWTRLTAVLTWIVVVSFQANPALQFDADPLLAVLAFYLMIGYAFYGQWSRDLSLAERTLGPRGTSIFALVRRRDAETPSTAANLALRLIQIHFVIAVVASGLHKLQFGDWWSGVAYWYALHPPFEMDAKKLQAAKVGFMSTLTVLSIAQYVALAWQLTFPAFAFRRGWRWLLLSGAAAAWLGMVFIYRLPLFGPIYAIGCLSYLCPGEWRRITDLLLALVPPRSGSTALAQEKKTPIKA